MLASTFICTVHTADMPAIVKGGDDYLQCLVYADDLAICSNNLCAIQQSIDRLYKYCSDNYLGINIGKTKIMTFRRGGHLAKSDVITCNGNPIEFVSKFTYLGVVFQTKGKLTGHFDHLRNKGIAACAKVAARMPLSKMSPAILARLFLAVVLPSATYGLSSIHTNETLDFLDEVQGRLIKAWFGVSKYCSTSSLRSAIGWRKASEFHLSTSAEPKCILDPLLPIPIQLPIIRDVIWGFGTATACITSGVVPLHAIPSIIHALAISVVKDNLPNSISFHAEPQLWPDTSLFHP